VPVKCWVRQAPRTQPASRVPPNEVERVRPLFRCAIQVCLGVVLGVVGCGAPEAPRPSSPGGGAQSVLRGPWLTPGAGAVGVAWAIAPDAVVAAAWVRWAQGGDAPPAAWASARLLVGRTAVWLTGLEPGVPVWVSVQAVGPDGRHWPATAPVSAVPLAGDAAQQVHVPAGTVVPGSADADPLPAPVWVDAFVVDRHPVTVAQYRACVQAGACPPPVVPHGYLAGRGLVPDLLADPEADAHPMPNLDVAAAQAVCAFRAMRLPSVVEWEMTARGPGWPPRPFPWGSARPTCDRIPMRPGALPCTAGTEPVGARPEAASPLRVEELAGAVHQWVVASPGGPDAGPQVLLVGGAWDAPGAAQQIGVRRVVPPRWRVVGDPVADYRAYGVRCVRSADPDGPGRAGVPGGAAR